MKSAVGSTGLHPRTTPYCNSDGRFAQIASWQYCSMAWPTLLDCRLRELRRNAADPFDTPEQIVIRERINCVNSLAHWQIITESESVKEPRGRSRSQSYSQIALLHSHLFLHDQLTFADISGTDRAEQLWSWVAHSTDF